MPPLTLVLYPAGRERSTISLHLPGLPRSADMEGGTSDPAEVDLARQVLVHDLGILESGLHVLGRRLEPGDASRAETNSKAVAETGLEVLTKGGGWVALQLGR